MAAYTTDKLLLSINLKAFVPQGQKTFQPNEILTIADEILSTKLSPSILTVREEYFVTYIDYSVVAYQQAYSIPDRAIGMIARDVKLVNTNGDLMPLVRIDPKQATTTQVTATAPGAFFLRGNDIVLYPTPAASVNVLRVSYYIRRGEMVPMAQGAVITSIDTVANSVTVAVIPSSWASGAIFDFINGTGSHDYRGIDFTSVTVGGPSLTFSSLPVGLIVGDMLALQGESPVVQLPPDYRPILATYVAAEMLRNQGMDTADVMEAKAAQLLSEGQQMITPRVTGEDVTIMPSWS